MSSQIRKRSLWMDKNQGEQADGYQGWFFSWPSDRPIITSAAEREAVIKSLEADETQSGEPKIPYRWAKQKLGKYLRANFDLRKRD
jgi:hypothetical protein